VSSPSRVALAWFSARQVQQTATLASFTRLSFKSIMMPLGHVKLTDFGVPTARAS